MKLSEKIKLVAGWLESNENDLLINAERDEKHLMVVAEALSAAAEMLKISADVVKETEIDVITPEALDEMAALATAFDESGDELLRKQASVLDEILLTFGAEKNAAERMKQAEDDRIEQLKKKYKDIHSVNENINKISDSLKLIEKAPAYKTHRPLEAPLSSRYCPDHAGIPVIRTGEHEWQCALDKKVYNYDTGFILLDNSKVPGGDVAEQTKLTPEGGQHVMFQSRSEKLGM